jgi:hypothetical protein
MAWSRGMTLVQDALDVARAHPTWGEDEIIYILDGQGYFQGAGHDLITPIQCGAFRMTLDVLTLRHTTSIFEDVEVVVYIWNDGTRTIHAVTGIQGQKWAYDGDVRVPLNYIQEG